jgi:hypothetical protein
VDFNPTRGAEIQKQRPAIVVSSDAIGRLPIKLVAPITGWKPAFAGNLWHVRVIPDRLNGLDKESAVDVLQLRGRLQYATIYPLVSLAALMCATQRVGEIAFDPLSVSCQAGELLVGHIAEPCQHRTADRLLILEDRHALKIHPPSLKLVQRDRDVSAPVIAGDREGK